MKGGTTRAIGGFEEAPPMDPGEEEIRKSILKKDV